MSRTSRIVGYLVVWPEESTVACELAADKILRGHADVVQYDVHTGGCWFDGRPGPSLRAVLREVVAATGGRSVSRDA